MCARARKSEGAVSFTMEFQTPLSYSLKLGLNHETVELVDSSLRFYEHSENS